MKKTLFILIPMATLLLSTTLTNLETASYQKDLEVIKKLAGNFKVEFNFTETFSSDSNYNFHPKYYNWGIEQVRIVDEKPGFISLQHLLIVNDSLVIKHWRQDWVYEEKEYWEYLKDKTWIKRKRNPEEVKGTWVQKVYQVDDGPRYESMGKWVHVNGRSYWQGECDAPLPRREFTKRKDYNVMQRRSHLELLEDGWVLEQDNKKVLRGEVDSILCLEKGIEKLTRGDYNVIPANKYWKTQELYWKDVRSAWSKHFIEKDTLRLRTMVNGKLSFQALFELGSQLCKEKYSSKEAFPQIDSTIQRYII